MEPAHALRDCPECRGVRTVILDVCYVCFAEFGERYEDEDAGIGTEAASANP